MGGSFEDSKVKMQVFDGYTREKKGKIHPPERVPDKKRRKKYTIRTWAAETHSREPYMPSK